MKGEIDETLLTAFALGELDAAEGAAVAAHVEGNAHARRLVEEVRETAALVADELALESTDGLGAIRRAVIEKRLRQTRCDARPRRRSTTGPRFRRWIPLATSIAASILIVLGALALMLPQFYGPPVASNPQTGGPDREGAPATDPDDAAQLGNPSTRETARSNTSIPSEALATNALPGGGFGPSRDDDTDGEPVEGMVDPREYWAAHEAARQEDTPEEVTVESDPTPAPPAGPAGPAAKVARGPAQSPEAEAVHGSATPKTPAKPAAPDGRRGVYVSPPRDSKAFERIKKNAASKVAAKRIYENPFRLATRRPRSSFPLRVETSSYRVVRNNLLENRLPPAHRVRIEELVNRFAYRYSAPSSGGPPVAAGIEIAACPWDASHRLARVAVKAREGGATVVARGVELSVEFNPQATQAWRLIGYENAPMQPGQSTTFPADLAAGGTATAFYEIVPVSGESRAGDATAAPADLFTVTIKCTDPHGGAAHAVQLVASDDPSNGFDRASEDFRFAASVAAFGMLLRDSQFKGTATFADVIRWATAGKGADETGERAAFIDLARRALDLTR